MLVLSRKKSEVINIGSDVTITVVEIRGDKCRLGIEAPKDLAVHRNEIFRAIQRDGEIRRKQNESTAGGSPPAESPATE